MSKREFILLYLFFIILIISLFCITFLPYDERYETIINNIANVNKAIKKMSDTMADTDTTSYNNNASSRLQEKKNLVEIADLIIIELNFVGITPDRYQLSNTNNSEIIEFTFYCNSYEICKFLEINSRKDTPYTIYSLSLKNMGNNINVSMKISSEPCYFKVFSSEFSGNPNFTKLFRSQQVVQESILSSDSLKKEVVIKKNIPANNLFKIIGFVKDKDEINYLYIKEIQSGKLFKIHPDNIIENLSDRCVFILNDINYELKK